MLHTNPPHRAVVCCETSKGQVYFIIRKDLPGAKYTPSHPLAKVSRWQSDPVTRHRHRRETGHTHTYIIIIIIATF